MKDSSISRSKFQNHWVCRSKYARYPEYHTSLDNFKLVTIKGVKGGYVVVKKSIEKILKKTFPICNIICEPQLGKSLYLLFQQRMPITFQVNNC